MTNLSLAVDSTAGAVSDYTVQPLTSTPVGREELDSLIRVWLTSHQGLADVRRATIRASCRIGRFDNGDARVGRIGSFAS